MCVHTSHFFGHPITLRSTYQSRIDSHVTNVTRHRDTYLWVFFEWPALYLIMYPEFRCPTVFVRGSLRRNVSYIPR